MGGDYEFMRREGCYCDRNQGKSLRCTIKYTQLIWSALLEELSDPKIANHFQGSVKL